MRRQTLEQGFTLIELMVVVAIVMILASVALVSHRHFTDKAKAVEAEVALAEVDRLQLVYYENHGSYAGDLNAMGFFLARALKYYTVQVQVQSGGAAYHALALPLTRSRDQTGLLLSRTSDGQVGVTKADPTTLVAQMGGLPGTGGNSLSAPGGANGATSGVGGKEPNTNCRAGGEASLAADGYLDMNFCFK